MYEVIDLSSVRFSEDLAECQVIHVLVRGRDLEGEGDRCRRSHGPWAHNLWGGRGRRRCPHPPVVGGVVQVFHELLVELRLLLVAEVEEGEEEDRQEEGWEVARRDQGEEDAHMDGMWMTVSGVRARLGLEPMWV